MIDPASVAAAHDAMQSEYDDVEDLWYTHLFNEIHRFIITLVPTGSGRTALDVGCGTGFQSLLLARAGYRVRGFDIADRLIETARVKLSRAVVDGRLPWPLYRTSLKPFMDEQLEIVARADILRGQSSFVSPEFYVGDANDPAAYAPRGYDVVVCCGSVLSFIDDHERVLGLLASAVRPDGLIFLEVEQRVNLDLLWPFVDLALGGLLDYEQDLKTCLGNLIAPPGTNVRVDYPFPLGTGEDLVLPIWLFSTGYMRRALERLGLSVSRRRGIHSLTNAFPSTVLHRAQPSVRTMAVFRLLARGERTLGGVWPFWRLGCSVLYCLRRRG